MYDISVFVAVLFLQPRVEEQGVAMGYTWNTSKTWVKFNERRLSAVYTFIRKITLIPSSYDELVIIFSTVQVRPLDLVQRYYVWYALMLWRIRIG